MHRWVPESYDPTTMTMRCLDCDMVQMLPNAPVASLRICGTSSMPHLWVKKWYDPETMVMNWECHGCRLMQSQTAEDYAMGLTPLRLQEVLRLQEETVRLAEAQIADLNKWRGMLAESEKWFAANPLPASSVPPIQIIPPRPPPSPLTKPGATRLYQFEDE